MYRLTLAVVLAALVACSKEEATAPVAPAESEAAGDPVTAPAGDAPGAAETHATSRAPRTTDLFSKTFGNPDDQAVIFVHGGPGANSFDFESSSAQALADRGYFVVTYDQRGCGRSPIGTMADYDYAKAGEDLDDLIFTRKLVKPVLLAHSFGGSVSLKYVETHADRAKGIVLAGSPISFPAMYHAIVEGSVDGYMRHFMKPKADEMKVLGQKMFPQGLVGPFTYSTDDIVACTKAMVESGLALPHRPSAASIEIHARMHVGDDSELASAFNQDLGEGYQQHDQVGYTDFTPLLKKHGAMVWGAYGEEDGIFDEAELASIVDAIGDSHMAKIEGASHFSYIDNPDAFVDVVARHLSAMK